MHIGHFLENLFKSSQIGVFVQKYAQCSETYEKSFSDFWNFYFLRWGQTLLKIIRIFILKINICSDFNLFNNIFLERKM